MSTSSELSLLQSSLLFKLILSDPVLFFQLFLSNLVLLFKGRKISKPIFLSFKSFKNGMKYMFNPISTGIGRNQPIYERHVTTASRNRVKVTQHCKFLITSVLEKLVWQGRLFRQICNTILFDVKQCLHWKKTSTEVAIITKLSNCHRTQMDGWMDRMADFYSLPTRSVAKNSEILSSHWVAVSNAYYSEWMR